MNQKVSINDIEVFSVRGPWVTKSGGNLDVLSAFDYNVLVDFFTYDTKELSISNEDIRGLRIYRVTNLKKGVVGANEWHRIKKELVIVTKGKVRWNLKDQSGNEREITLTPHNNSLLIPSFILHTYTSLEDDSEIVILTNTLFNPENHSTFDTYPIDTF
jgi:dTDP-4-dehydrorhamnose 3,5-epimerase-like enzyme